MHHTTRVISSGIRTSIVCASALLLSVGCGTDAGDEGGVGGAVASAGSAGVGGGMAGGAGASPNGGSPTAGSGGAPVGSSGSATTAGSGGSNNGGGSSGGSGGSNVGGSSGGSAGGTQTTPDVTPCATNVLSKCTGTPLACHFGGDPGNYEVTVQLGAGGETEVEAEYYRRMLTQTTSADAKWFSFVTNVRVYEGEPLRPDQDGTTSKGIPGLDIYFRGKSPKPVSICYQPMTKPLMLWIEGDSTVTDQESTDYSGWGQHLPQHFVSPISVANYADSGESSGSVLNSAKLWGTIKSGMKAGDWVMLQIGHNDKDTSAATFKSNVLKMITDTKAANAHMILVTPISRVGYTLAQEHVNSTGANLPQIIRDLGKSESVPVIDLTVTTYDWLQTIKWQDYFALGTDHTHTNPAGADIVSGFVRDAVKAQNLELAKYLR